MGFTTAPDGNHYVWGGYHGYNDGTTNDTQQRFISRLYGLHVGVGEVGKMEGPQLKIYPNPAQDRVIFEFAPQGGGELVVKDLQGRTVFSRKLGKQEGQVVWDTRSIAQGTYSVMIRQGKDKMKSETLIIQR